MRDLAAPSLQEPVSLQQRRAWDATWRWLLGPSPEERESRAGADEGMEPIDLAQERRERASRDRTRIA